MLEHHIQQTAHNPFVEIKLLAETAFEANETHS